MANRADMRLNPSFRPASVTPDHIAEVFTPSAFPSTLSDSQSLATTGTFPGYTGPLEYPDIPMEQWMLGGKPYPGRRSHIPFGGWGGSNRTASSATKTFKGAGYGGDKYQNMNQGLGRGFSPETNKFLKAMM